MFDKLYDEQEQVKVRFVGFITEQNRYDFGIVYSAMFFGKPLVICMQTGRSALIDDRDIEHPEHLQHVFQIEYEQAYELAEFFSDILPNKTLEPEFE